MDEKVVSEQKMAELESRLSAEGLRGKQSVRATFRLPNHIIELLGLVAAQLNLKQKSLFDQLVEDAVVLDQVARKAGRVHPQAEDKRQKTFVLSRRSLQVLESVARRRKIPRDLLVEISIRRLVPLMNEEQRRHSKRIELFREMEQLLMLAERLRRGAAGSLGEEDPFYELSEKIVVACAEQLQQGKEVLEKGESMARYAAYRSGGEEVSQVAK